MSKRFVLAVLTTFCVVPASVAAQSPPSSVFIEELTWVEIRDAMQAGKTAIIIPTAGTEQKGPHMVMGEHGFVIRYTSDKIARTLGNALVSPVMTYVPEGEWGANAGGHMLMPGTITLPNEWFMEVLTHTAKSHAASGFKDIIFIGDSGGNQNGMRQVTEELNKEWAGTGVRAHFIGDYYTKSSNDVHEYLAGLGFNADQWGGHAGMIDTSELMFVNSNLIRSDKLALRGGFEGSGVSGDSRLASQELGAAFLRIKIDNALAQIRASLASN